MKSLKVERSYLLCENYSMWFNTTHYLWQKFLNLLFPTRCVGCRSEGEIICPTCASEIERPFNEVLDVEALFTYRDRRVARVIWKLKYGGASYAAECLGLLLGEFVLTDLADNLELDTQNWVLAPVPLSAERLKERGYNQALLLAKGVSRVTGIQVMDNVLSKTKNTKTQVSLKNRTERLGNLRGAFMVTNPVNIKGRKIIIIDDVHTTGTTIREITCVLENAGALEVRAYTLAH